MSSPLSSPQSTIVTNFAGASRTTANRFDGFYSVHAVDNFAKDNVSSIEPPRFNCGDEKLGTIRAGASIGHAKQARLGVFEFEVFVCEFLTVDALATGAVTIGKVTTLKHELWNDTMEYASLVMEWLAGFSITFFARAKSTKVFLQSLALCHQIVP